LNRNFMGAGGSGGDAAAQNNEKVRGATCQWLRLFVLLWGRHGRGTGFSMALACAPCMVLLYRPCCVQLKRVEAEDVLEEGLGFPLFKEGDDKLGWLMTTSQVRVRVRAGRATHAHAHIHTRAHAHTHAHTYTHAHTAFSRASWTRTAVRSSPRSTASSCARTAACSRRACRSRHTSTSRYARMQLLLLCVCARTAACS
jgi:hypothetical protein